tara:strand:- start:382 stop:576 length:195 start_codon:yes stop_codon:yes gene_type:complete
MNDNKEDEFIPGEETIEFIHAGDEYDNEHPIENSMRKETERNVVFLGLIVVGVILLLVIGTFVS